MAEIKALDATLKSPAGPIDDIQRLQTIPGVGPVVSMLIYAWVGDVSRFPNAKRLASYTGLVPRVRQSGNTAVHGQITKQGSVQLRSGLVQSAQVLLSVCRSEDAKALQCIGLKVKDNSGKTKIAITAVARHIVRIAFYILRDQGTYDASLISAYEKEKAIA